MGKLQAEVAVMYVGLGQAYYVTSNGTSAGVGISHRGGLTSGRAGSDERCRGARSTRAIAILRNEPAGGRVRAAAPSSIPVSGRVRVQ